MAAYGFILMLMVSNSLALWNPYMGARQSANTIECTEFGTFCSSCTEAYLCTGAGATPLNLPCDSTQVCVENGPIQAACGEYVGVEAGDCDCDMIGNSGFLIDPFDSSKYILCVPAEFQYFLSCPDGEVFSTTDNACGVATTTAAPTTTAPTTTPAGSTTPTADTGSPGGVDQVDSSTDTVFCSENGIGLFTDDPTCQTYTACYSASLPGLLLECNAGEVFDSSALICVAECDLAPATFSCPANAAGALPDTTDCSIFHVCSNGLLVTPASGISCPDGEIFEPTSMTCVADSPDAVCPEVDSCWAAYCESCGVTCPEFRSDVTTPSSGGNSGDTTPASSGSSGDSTGSSGDSTGDSTADPTSTPISTTTTTTPEITTTTTPEPTTTPKLSTTTATSTPDTTSSTTTTTPAATTTPGAPDCGNAAGVYEDTTDCSQFYQCEANDSGVYEAILFSCPSPLVFVPSLGYCFLQSSLSTAPGCIAS